MSLLLRIQEVLDDLLCYEQVRELRWSEGLNCPYCQSTHYKRNGHHQPLKVWFIWLNLMSQNQSNAQIAKELGISQSESQAITRLLREGEYEKRVVV